jgi:DNA-binding transcriptional MerR regulator
MGREESFVIDELSRRTGLTVRSIRAYQSRKLLPPPEVRGRTGYYDARHVARIELIKDLQSEGLKLDSIARMLDNAGRSDADLLRFTRTVTELFGETPGAMSTSADLRQRFGVSESHERTVLNRAEKLGLIRAVGDGNYEVLSPRLLDAGEHAVHVLGLDADEALRVLSHLRRHADGVARTYLDLYVARVWGPFVEAGQPAEQWSDVEAALQHVRDLATEALLSAFELVMSERVGEVFGRELTRQRRGRS